VTIKRTAVGQYVPLPWKNGSNLRFYGWMYKCDHSNETYWVLQRHCYFLFTCCPSNQNNRFGIKKIFPKLLCILGFWWWDCYSSSNILDWTSDVLLPWKRKALCKNDGEWTYGNYAQPIFCFPSPWPCNHRFSTVSNQLTKTNVSSKMFSPKQKKCGLVNVTPPT